MSTAQDFIRELRTRKVLNDKYIAIIEQSLLQPAGEIPAADLAGYLVEQMIISAAVSNAILEHLQEERLQASDFGLQEESLDGVPAAPNTNPEVRSPKPDDVVDLVPTSRSAKKKPPAPTSPPQSPPPKAQPDYNRGQAPVPIPPPKVSPEVRSPKPEALTEASWRIKEKQRESQWDTPLVKYGIIALGLLVLASVVLAWLLMQRRADEVFSIADAAYRNGAYARAIDGYKDFITSFENNAAVPKAKLRIALSRIRLITETKSNWDKALACVQEELPEMSRLPDFASEGRIEMSAILPNIAEGLATMADTSNNADLIRQSETALALVDEHVPGTMQPFNQMQATRRSLELTRRRIARDTEIVTVKSEITTMLDAVKSATSDDGNAGILPTSLMTRQQLAECYALLMRYLHTHPEMRDNPMVAAIKSDIARTEALCQRWEEEGFRLQTSGIVEEQNAENKVQILPSPVMLLTHRVGLLTPVSVSDINPEVRSPKPEAFPARLFVTYANQNVYAINPDTGSIVWQHHVGLPGLDRNVPMVMSGFPNNNTLLADDRSKTLLMVDTATGSERFRLVQSETTYINPQPIWPIHFVTTSGGKLMLVNLVAGERLGYIDLMQNVDAPPCYDPERQLVVQPAHHSALHVFRYDVQANIPLTNVGIIPTGHLAGTIQSAPIVHMGYLLVAEQTAPTRTTIKIYAPIKASGSGLQTSGSVLGTTPEAGSLNPETSHIPWSEQPIQTIPLDGLVKSPPIVDDNDLLYMAERGDVKLISLVGADPVKPYHIVADGRIDDVLKRSEAVSGRFAALVGRSLWVADNRLQHFEVQPSRSRLIPQSLPTTPSIISQSPIEIADNYLMQSYVDPMMGGVTARSFALANLANRWQTEFGESVSVQPVVSANGETLHLVTVTGKLYDLPISELTTQRDTPMYNTEAYMRQRVASGTLTEPVTDIVPLENGLEVLCCISPNMEMTNLPTQSAIRVYDGISPQLQIRTIGVPAPLTSPVVPLGQGIVVPLANGQLAFYSPRDGTVIGNPFVTRRTQDAPPKWSPMTLIQASDFRLQTSDGASELSPEVRSLKPEAAILIGDADGLLRQIELVTHNNRPALVMTKSVQLPCGVAAKPLVCGQNVIIASNAGHLLLFDYEQLTPEGNVLSSENREQSSESKDQNGKITLNSELCTLNLDSPIVWGPFACGPSAVVAVTENHTFVTIAQADQLIASRSPTLNELPLEHGMPVGQPVALNESQLLFITRKGTLLRYDLPQNTLTPIIETGVTPSCGPVVVQSKIIVIGVDGAVYVF